MMLEKDQLVQIRFNNGIFFDAIVCSWSDEKSVVRLPNSADIVIIQKTLQDVLLVRILNKEEIKSKNQIEQEFNELKQKPKDEKILQTMADLKDQLNTLEREEYAAIAKAEKITGAREIVYGYPINGVKKHTTQKTAAKSSAIGPGLQGLFNKKH